MITVTKVFNNNEESQQESIVTISQVPNPICMTKAKNSVGESEVLAETIVPIKQEKLDEKEPQIEEITELVDLINAVNSSNEEKELNSEQPEGVEAILSSFEKKKRKK